MEFSAWKDSHLQRYSMDLLTVLEKSGYLENAVITEDTSQLQNVIAKTSKSLCFLLNIKDSGETILSLQKQDCKITYKRRLITRRTFIARGDQTKVYEAELYGWYKEEL